jgi:hypothetical protein
VIREVLVDRHLDAAQAGVACLPQPGEAGGRVRGGQVGQCCDFGRAAGLRASIVYREVSTTARPPGSAHPGTVTWSGSIPVTRAAAGVNAV